MKKYLGSVRWISLMTVVVLLVGCAQGTPQPKVGAVGRALNVRLPSDFDTLDPYHSGTPAGIYLQYLLYDRLVALAPDGKTIVAYLAKSWVQTPTSISFTLRSGATCSDGTPITPKVVADSLGRLIDPATHTYLLTSRLGLGPYSITKDDSAGTVTISVGTPFNDMLVAFSTWGTGIICPAGLANPSMLATQAYGSGPYTLVSVARGTSVTLKRRADWKWGPLGRTNSDNGVPDSLVFKVIADETTAANLLLTGGLDVGYVLGPDGARLRADKSLTYQAGVSNGVNTLQFNESPGLPGADMEVRKALFTAIDPKAYSKAAYGADGAVVATSFISPATLCFDPKSASLVPKPSLDAAKTILANDGYVNTNGKLSKAGTPLSVNLLASSSAFGEGPAYVQAQWTALGVDVSLTSLDTNTYIGKLFKGAFQAVITPYASSASPTPTTTAGPYAGAPPPQGSNYANLQDSLLTSEYQAAISSPLSERCQHWVNFQEELLRSSHLLPLVSRQYSWFGKSVGFVAWGGYLDGSSIRAK